MVSTNVPINSFYVRFGARIRRLRQKAGHSQKDFGAMVGYSSPMMTMIEQGKRDPNLEKLVRMARALGVTVDFLLTGESK